MSKLSVIMLDTNNHVKPCIYALLQLLVSSDCSSNQAKLALAAVANTDAYLTAVYHKLALMQLQE